MTRILLAEDETNIASFIRRGLTEAGYEVSIASDGQAALDMLEKESFQLLILDIIMPYVDGLELCRRYRSKFGYQTPVLMLTALGTTEDIVAGLDAGADDYLAKPFRFSELEARVMALLRRGNYSNNVLVCGDLSLDTGSRRASRGGQTIDLTVREYRLLEFMMLNQGKALSRDDLLHNVWDKNFDRTNIADVYVNYLRAKIDKNFDKKLIQTVIGVGYRLES